MRKLYALKVRTDYIQGRIDRIWYPFTVSIKWAGRNGNIKICQANLRALFSISEFIMRAKSFALIASCFISFEIYIQNFKKNCWGSSHKEAQHVYDAHCKSDTTPTIFLLLLSGNCVNRLFRKSKGEILIFLLGL